MTEPITLEEYYAQEGKLTERALDSGLRTIDIISVLEASKIAVSIQLYVKARNEGLV